MLTLLCAPSSTGKSTFYESEAFQKLLGVNELPPIIFAHEFPNRTSSPDPSVIHYNLMRPFVTDTSTALNEDRSFADDDAWRAITALPGDKQAIVLAASKSDLLDRSASRQQTEPTLRAKSGAYDSAKWQSIYRRANLESIYSKFLRECEARGIAVLFIAARDGTFEQIDEVELWHILREPPSRYTQSQIRELIKGPNFRYQAVPLPFGLSTSGRDRSATTNAVLPTDLTGQSVLDIGSALGAVAFEAEKRGAARVVGLEPRASRFEGSLTLKEILSSQVEFRCENLTDYARQDSLADRPEQFDYVLLLNVIHHLDNPIEALEICASLTKRVLAVEFPTLEDPKFAGVPKELAERLNGFALMGVSTRAVDQTFVFTPAAIERLLMDHRQMFRSVRFKPSPMANRMIALFEK